MKFTNQPKKVLKMILSVLFSLFVCVFRTLISTTRAMGQGIPLWDPFFSIGCKAVCPTCTSPTGGNSNQVLLGWCASHYWILFCTFVGIACWSAWYSFELILLLDVHGILEFIDVDITCFDVWSVFCCIWQPLTIYHAIQLNMDRVLSGDESKHLNIHYLGTHLSPFT